MIPLLITASALITAAGRGEAALLAALQQDRTGLVPNDFADTPRAGYIGRVAGLDDWQLPQTMAKFQCRNNALADMALREPGFLDAVSDLRERYGASRIATVIGTSTSGILSAEEAYRRRASDGALPADFLYDTTYDLFSITRFVRQTLGLRGPALTVSTACASSARAFIDAHHLIVAGLADAAVVGGADTLCRLTLHGFASLDLISSGPCQPCDAARNGISIGEAAGFVILERARHGAGSVALRGFGASSDGYHLSSPRPDGAGAAQAMAEALRSAGLTAHEIDYINLHGTGTRANDAMEDAAVVSVFGGATPCSSTKHYTGHTMGSCGIVEAVIAKLCIEHGFIPRCGGLNIVDPGFGADVVNTARQQDVRWVLSNAFGFGGMNCSLLFGAA